VQVLEGLIAGLRERCAALPDRRTGRNGRYAMADIGLAAFSVFFMQSPSFLAHQRSLARARGRSNCETLFAMTAIPSDNHIRQMLDGTPASHFDPLFAAVLSALEAEGGLSAFRCLSGRVLIALDGSEHFTSRKLHCPHCSQRRRSDGGVEYFHAFLGATLVAPGHGQVVPLPAEFITPQDGTDKQDCESRAVRRWLAARGQGYARLDPVYLGDDLYSRQPICAAVAAAGGHFLFVCKPSSHRTIEEYLSGIDLPEHRVTVRRGRDRKEHRYRWLEGVPLRDGADATSVNWFSIEIEDARGKITYRNSFVTDLPVGRDSVAELAACGRARWKIENESFNVLKSKGYHLEHNFGHGKQTLSSVLVSLNLLAFAMHNACDLIENLWKQARATAGARQRLFEHLRSITAYLVFAGWSDLVTTLVTGIPPPQPPPTPR
jgi:hypothetical protein